MRETEFLSVAKSGGGAHWLKKRKKRAFRAPTRFVCSDTGMVSDDTKVLKYY